MLRHLFIFCLFSIIVGCKNEPPKTEKRTQLNKEQKEIPASGQFIHDGITFDYKYDNNSDNTEIKILGKTQQTYNAKGQVTKHFFSDLDEDTKDEAFIVLRDKKGNNILKSYYISKDTPTEISLNQVSNIPPNSTVKYSSQYGQIIEKIEIKTPDNKAVRSEARYNLVAGESAYSLKPQGWNKEQLKTKRGQYKTGMYGKEKYYNKMYINESETGEWIVDIKVKDSKTERNVCEFQAIGEFINKDLYVPLNEANPSLDGVLQIRYAGKSTIVYTQDVKDAKQMLTFCDGKGNLSGNYTKLKVLYE